MVAWATLWGGSRSTKPCVFPCRVAAGDDARYLVCAAGAAGVVSCANWFLLCVLQRVVVSGCVVLCVSWISGCGSHWNGCVKVAWAILWGGSRSTKPCVFPYKVAAADDETYLVCAAGAAGVVSCANWFLLCVLQRVAAFVCVVLCVSWISGCGSHWNGCVKVAWATLWGGSRSTKPCVFPCKVAAGDEHARYLVCAAGAAGVVSCANWFLLCVLRRVVVSGCVVLCVSWISGCGSHWNGCVKVAWAILWGGSRSTKPCVFPYKVAAADDERYLVCAAGAAGVVSCANWFLLCVLQRVVAFVCVVLFVSWISGCGSHWNGCVKVAWATLWGGSRSTKPCVFPCKVAAGDDARYTSCVRRVRLGSFHARIGSSSMFCNA